MRKLFTAVCIALGLAAATGPVAGTAGPAGGLAGSSHDNGVCVACHGS